MRLQEAFSWVSAAVYLLLFSTPPSSAQTDGVSFVAADAVNWNDAKASCEADGGQLASCTDRESCVELHSLCQGDCWVGYSSPNGADMSSWSWEDGAVVDEDYLNEGDGTGLWAASNPSGFNLARCALFRSISQSLYSSRCTSTRIAGNEISGYLCSIPVLLPKWEYIATELEWTEARDFCLSIGGDLARITSDLENSGFAELLRDEAAATSDVWLGATDAATEGEWKWISTDETFWQGTASGSAADGAYENWSGAQPDNGNGGQHCGVFEYSANADTWADEMCSATRPFVCELTAPPPPQRFFYHSETEFWDDANQTCAEDGHVLPSVLSEEKNEFLLQFANYEDSDLSSPIWLGGHDKFVEGSWTWLDGSGAFWEHDNNEELIYANWNAGEPNDFDGEDCLQMDAHGAGGWNDAKCGDGDAKPFICEFVPSWHTWELHEMLKTWHDASQECVARGGNLASIMSEHENYALRSLLHHHGEGAASVWVGGNDQLVEGHWTWSDKSGRFFIGDEATGGAIDGFYTNWDEGAPGEAEGDCMEVLPSGKWNNVDCEAETRFYVCETPPTPVATSAPTPVATLVPTSAAPTPMPTPVATLVPTSAAPTPMLTPVATLAPTSAAPTPMLTPVATLAPTSAAPTPMPTPEQTAETTLAPTPMPTAVQTAMPTTTQTAETGSTEESTTAPMSTEESTTATMSTEESTTATMSTEESTEATTKPDAITSPTSPEVNATDPSATDPSATDPSSTDPSSTDASSTDGVDAEPTPAPTPSNSVGDQSTSGGSSGSSVGDGDGSGSSLPMIIGGTAGGAALIVALIVLGYLHKKREARKERDRFYQSQQISGIDAFLS